MRRRRMVQGTVVTLPRTPRRLLPAPQSGQQSDQPPDNLLFELLGLGAQLLESTMHIVSAFFCVPIPHLADLALMIRKLALFKHPTQSSNLGLKPMRFSHDVRDAYSCGSLDSSGSSSGRSVIIP